MKAFLQGLRTGFGLLGEMGVRGGRNPIKHYRGISNKLSRHGSVAQTGGVVPANALLGGYRITGTRPIPPEVAESTAVPDAMWEAFKMVKASLRDQSYFKALASTTARNAEIGSATFAGFAAGFGETFLVRNKGQGPTAIKAVRWDADAQQAYRLYFELERMQHDPLTPKFRRWAAKCHLALTPEHYLEFLIAARQDLTTVPLFLTERGHPYSAATFRRGIWTAAKAVSTIKAAPHHLRHANVNLRLQAVWNDFGAEPHLYVGALIEYVKEMGWRCWQTLAHYDYRGVATHALNEHYSPKNKRFRVDHGGLGGELMDRVHDDMIHAPTRSSTQ